MTQFNKDYMVANFEQKIGSYAGKGATMKTRGIDSSIRDKRLWLMMNMLDLIMKHDIVDEGFNLLTHSEMNNLISYINGVLNTNYDFKFE